MKYTQIKIEEIETMYPKIVIADKLNQILFERSEDGCMLFTKTIARQILKLTLSTEYCDELFRLELCHSIEAVANLESNLSMFGLPWFAKDGNILKVLDVIEDAAKEENPVEQ